MLEKLYKYSWTLFLDDRASGQGANIMLNQTYSCFGALTSAEGPFQIVRGQKSVNKRLDVNTRLSGVQRRANILTVQIAF